jgi:hypothetical protein
MKETVGPVSTCGKKLLRWWLLPIGLMVSLWFLLRQSGIFWIHPRVYKVGLCVLEIIYEQKQKVTLVFLYNEVGITVIKFANRCFGCSSIDHHNLLSINVLVSNDNNRNISVIHVRYIYGVWCVTTPSWNLNWLYVACLFKTRAKLSEKEKLSRAESDKWCERYRPSPTVSDSSIPGSFRKLWVEQGSETVQSVATGCGMDDLNPGTGEFFSLSNRLDRISGQPNLLCFLGVKPTDVWSWLPPSSAKVKDERSFCNENQLEVLFILNLFRRSTSTRFGHLLPIIRRYTL